MYNSSWKQSFEMTFDNISDVHVAKWNAEVPRSKLSYGVTGNIFINY